MDTLINDCALRRDILKLVVGQGMVLVAYGLALGLLLGFANARVDQPGI